jgi:phosphoglycolate phosphatase
MIKGYIFDLDGTLLDTLANLAGTFNRTLARFGYPEHPEDAYRYFIGDGLRKCVERCLPSDAHNEELIARFTETQQQDYEEVWHEAPPYPGIAELIATLNTRNDKVAALSNKPDSFTKRCIDHHFPDQFDFVLGSRYGVPHKPDPTGAFMAARELKLEPAEIAYIGDTATDMQTGVSAGMLTIGVLWGFRDRNELKNAGATHIINSPADLMAVTKAE